VPPAAAPSDSSTTYVGASNGTLPKKTVVPGQAFNRFIQIWFENTDYATTVADPTFQSLTKQGILLDNHYAVTHPSEPNYVSVVGGDFFGLGDDNMYNIPSNISTIVDLLDQKNISWASYQESMPTDDYGGYNFTSPNYLNTSAPPYTYYVRKHNPLVIYDSVAQVPARASLLRNFNDFAADLNASVIPQWSFITPNMVDDGHDTNVTFISNWIKFWLIPLLQDTRFNDNGTLILLTFDENETYTVNNQIWALLLGGAVPTTSYGTSDSTYYTHFSALSSVQNNWGLGSLGRFDTNKTMANVYSLVANKTGYQNLHVTNIPHTNLTGVYPGPLNRNMYVPFTAPNTSAVGAGGGKVFVSPSLNLNLTASNAPAPVNLTALNETVPASGSASAPVPSATKSGARRDAIVGGAVVLSALAGGAVLFL